MKNVMILLLILAGTLAAQEITWTEITGEYDVPEGVTVFKGERESPKLQIRYIKADLKNEDLAVRSYIGPNKTVKSFQDAVGAYAAVNGGFFGGSVSYSAVVYPGEVKAQNVPAVTRNSQSYPVIRSFFGMKEDKSLTVDWIYHYGPTLEDIYTFEEPMQYAYNDPAPKPAPLQSEGTPMENLLTGIGGGPVLVKDSSVNVTYNEEIMWGSGVGLSNGDPRTAVGYTGNREVIMITADGRQPASQGVGLPELAQIMLDLGCVAAVNLDGGGSTQMAIGGEYVNSPSENRAVPTILAVVHIDSLGLPKEPVFEKIIDTADTLAVEAGGGWFETANAGFWGETKSLLHGLGNGEASYTFNLELPAEAEYEVYGWWVAANNRSGDTPFIVNHANGTDTVRVDQTTNGSMWHKIGTYTFSGGEPENVIISDFGTTGTYVVADAIRVISYDPATISSVETEKTAPEDFVLMQNYPNPFNPETTISFKLASAQKVKLAVYDILGEETVMLLDGAAPAGTNTVKFNGAGLSSGVYFARLQAGARTKTIKLMLMK